MRLMHKNRTVLLDSFLVTNQNVLSGVV